MATDHDIESHDSKNISDVHDAACDSVNGVHDDSKHINGNSTGDDDHVDTEVQPGVQDIEAVTLSWTRISLIIAYILIWLAYFVQGIVSGVSASLLPFVTSAFAEHSLTPTVSVLSAVIGGVTNLSIAKVLDIFGRPQGFVSCIVLATVGLIMSAACNNVKAYAASQVFYTVGINGIGYCLSVFIADTTSLRHRGLIQSLLSSPTIITAWLAGPISTAFLNGAGWRWAFGMESILVPVVTLPLFGLFMYNYSKAKKLGLVPARQSRGSVFESLRYYAREFDIVGLLSLSTGVAFFLLPFDLYTLQAKGWNSPLIICFLVFGILLLIAFGVWEKFFAKVCFVPWKLLKDRTAGGACLLAFVLFFSYMCWGAYFSSILMVVNDLSVTKASYVVQTYSVGSFIFAIAAGGIISYTGRFKPVTLYMALPMAILGTGLMINFRGHDGNVGYIVMCQVFIAFASGTIMLTDEIAILAAVDSQQNFAIAIALVSMFASIGSAVGLTASAAIWQHVLPKQLAVYLPEEELPNLVMIYSDIMMQLSYAVGTPTRLAIQHAYADAEKYLLCAGIAIWVLGFVGTMMWRDINVINVKQTRGQVV